VLTDEDEEQIYVQAVRELDDQLTFDPSQLPAGVEPERVERAKMNARALQALIQDFDVANEPG
jgi:hypothetical protein